MTGLYVAGFALGCVIGSFLNVCIYRMPRNLSVVMPPSACTSCKKRIAWWDNVPLFSFILLRGRCRHCGNAIRWRYPLVEALGGMVPVVALGVWGWSVYALMACILFWSFIVVTFIDFDYQIIPDEISIAGIFLGLGFSTVFHQWLGARTVFEGFLGAIGGAVVGGGILLLMGILGQAIFKKEAMGGGDVKLLAAIGAFLGWKGVLLALFIASLLGALVGLALRLIRGDERIPFGPYIVTGAVIYMIWGPQLTNGYLRLWM